MSPFISCHPNSFFGVSSLHLSCNQTTLPLWVLPLAQIKCSFQSICGNRKTVRSANCVLHSSNVISKSGISECPFDRFYKISWGCLVWGDDNTELLARYPRCHAWLIIGYG